MSIRRSTEGRLFSLDCHQGAWSIASLLNLEKSNELGRKTCTCYRLLGAFATWLFLGPLAAFGLQIWAAFIMWGAFYHCGGGVSGFKAVLAGGVWGAIMAAVALALITKIGGGPLGAAICVGITVAIFILGANISLLAVIPAAVYGYSAVAAWLCLNPVKTCSQWRS
jgi:Protein of unknown function (DUF1097)